MSYINSSSSSSGSSNVNYKRITGLASGLDIEGLIGDLMKAERIPLDRIKQKKQIAEWKKEQYRLINSKILALRTAYFDNVNMSSNLKSITAFKTFSVTSGDPGKVTVTATGEAKAGVHTISVTKLATSAQSKSSTTSVAEAGTADFTGYDATNNTLTITLNGVSHNLTLSDQADLDSFINDIQSQINANSSLKGKVYAFKSEDGKLSIKANSGVVELTGSALTEGKIAIADGTDIFGDINTVKIQDLKGFQGSSGDFTYSSDNITFTINGRKITIAKTKTVGDLVAAVNASGAGVTMSYNSFTGGFSIVSNTTGSAATLTLADTDGTDFLAKSGLLANVTAGQDARYKIDGTEGVSSTNSVTVDGVIYTLKDTTTSDVTVTVSSNIDSVVDTIKGFVSKYNEMIDLINKKLKEERYRDFQPLTDDQKNEMKEKDIELWEEKAKSGLLKGDMLISGCAADFRMAVSGKVQGSSYAVLASIGITTGNYLEGGKLSIDESRLRDALSSNPDEVMKLFNNKVTNADGSINYEQSGIAYKIDQMFTKYVSTSAGNYGLLVQKAGTDVVNTVNNELQHEIRGYDEKITELNIELIDIEDRYYKKFTALEVAMNKMGMQNQWLMNQLGGGQGY